ncbi:MULTISPECIES: LysR family transcriptional regulator [unclassified Mycolicibacterium]|uniref:LysR family transcriptional regulator n=1 Tax=unclassified Mycolicibacterium TaxID=2636767 RepID=UPI0012DC4A2F|nr:MULTISPECIES: LysR family transcriptional regulator [unclassified Mycolicibacterium]MUL85394.1 LysR family transcriptional regulator [Mycolicibacterium sp. CBMA 329]MUL88842.1 LysR family transcriptional regulator [Mycolicibacterium sp. CBMA 331]MUM01884.1 LysR family transcriptional regulator [Mycolicibacterium sp. CBMA 334]MUM27611.1 LysR family transcriptional regulator [Mycolicibacterium sp. CBMA 295]MUM40489.1 LysR family transcriptional regulator [Mycolicibacterium sp. CBMA 247]
MDTHRLKYFLRIAEERSITRAAGLLGIAQPALSRQLQLLEEDLGVALFTRTRRGVELTEAGERLRASTAGPLRQLELAVQYAGTPLARLDRTMRLGLPETTVDLLSAPLLGSLTTVFPEATFSVTVGSTDQLVEAMLKGAVDVALINPIPDERVFYRELLAEELFVIGGPDSTLDATGAVEFSDVVALPLVVPRSSSGIGTSLQNAALRTKVKFSYRTTTDSLAVMKNLIEAGIAYGVLPMSACRREIDDGRLRFAPIAAPVLTQRLGVGATAQLELPRELSMKIGDTIREEVAALIRSGKWNAELISTQPWNPMRG